MDAVVMRCLGRSDQEEMYVVPLEVVLRVPRAIREENQELFMGLFY